MLIVYYLINTVYIPQYITCKYGFVRGSDYNFSEEYIKKQNYTV